MKANYNKNKGLYKSRLLSSVEKERIERMLVYLKEGNYEAVENYFKKLLSDDRSTNGLEGTANKFSKSLSIRKTNAEKKMEQLLIDLNITFKSQRIVHYGNGKNFYILDFYLPADKLAIELDGSYHNDPEQIEKDLIRTRTLQEKGISMLRFKNEEMNNVNDVKERVLKSIKYYVYVDSCSVSGQIQKNQSKQT